MHSFYDYHLGLGNTATTTDRRNTLFSLPHINYVLWNEKGREKHGYPAKYILVIMKVLYF